MLGFAFALLTAFNWGAGFVFTRLGLRGISTGVATTLSLIASVVVALVATLLIERQALASLPAAGIAWFALTGVVNFVAGRLFSFQSIERIGASRSAPLFATSPLFAIAIAIVFTGERLTAPLLAGTLLIVGGIWLVVGGTR
jgi:drug/metabolite transporter (DMT)-like permease